MAEIAIRPCWPRATDRVGTGEAAHMTQEVILAAVINWNGWRDTRVCLRSMLALSGPPFHLLVCDNGSTDESREQLLAWARDAAGAAEVSYRELGEGAAVTSMRGSGAFGAGLVGAVQSIHVMTLPRNLGYAGAINRCVQWGRESLAPDYFWLLNNDVSLDEQALAHLLAAVRTSSDIGLCGSVLLDWEPPHHVQAIGGVYKRWPAVGVHVRQLTRHEVGDGSVSFDFDYPVGASLLASRRFVETVGLMDEDYFLYYEEVDWALRGRRLGFRPAVALQSRMRHKEGASSGSIGGLRHKSLLSEYYGIVSRMRFTQKHYPMLLPAVWLSLVLVTLERAAHFEWCRAALVLKLMLLPSRVHRPDATSAAARRADVQ